MEKPKTPQIAKAIQRQKKKAGGIILCDSKLHCKPVVIETVWHWH